MNDEQRVNALAQYKAERSRGLVHTEVWDRVMAAERRWFDEVYMPAAWTRMGYEPEPGNTGGYLKVRRDPFWKRVVRTLR